MSLSEILDTARAAAAAAAAVHRQHLGAVPVTAWAEKGFADFVSHVDHESEAAVVGIVRDRFPTHAVLAEEAGASAGEGGEEWLWVVDPLDGTTNYLHAYPMYAVSIAVLRRGHPVVGVVINSASGQEWTAVAGGGAFLDGQRIQVSAIEDLGHALVGTGFPFKAQQYIPEYLEQFGSLLRCTSGIRRAGAAAVDLCHVASGFLDGFWELSLAPWDVAAGVLMVREAGGVVTRLGGSEAVIGHGSVLAGNPHVYRQLMDALGGREPREN